MPNSPLDILQEGDYSLNINGVSRHLNTNKQFNENNDGFGITRDYGESLATLGYYKNSLNKDSYYAGYGWKKRFGKDAYVDLGMLGGVVTGYQDKLTPMALPMASFGLKDLGQLNLMYAPKYKGNPAVLMMNLGIPFK